MFFQVVMFVGYTIISTLVSVDYDPIKLTEQAMTLVEK